MDATICTLGEIPVCHRSNCPTCGWNAEVAACRREYLRQHGPEGLTLCSDGLRRLIINCAKDAAVQENAVTQQNQDVKEQV